MLVSGNFFSISCKLLLFDYIFTLFVLIPVKQYTMTIYHMSCTNQMGPPTNPWAVVDPQLRVYGVSGLRVIDASISKY